MRIDGFNELLQQARRGEPPAIDRMFVSISHRLKHLVLSQNGFNCAAESVSDLIQEVAVRIWQKLDQFQGAENDAQSYAMFLQWVDQVGRRMASDMRRKRKAQRRRPANGIVPLELSGSGNENIRSLEPASGQQSPSWAVRASEREQAVKLALDSLRDETARRIVCMRFFDGLSLRQISEQLGLSYDKVRERYNSSLRTLEQALDGFQ
jgi:RNA polymerase sigma factor (sigma-70 family)